MSRPQPANPWARWALDLAERGLRAYAASWTALIVADQVYDQFNPAFWELFPAALPGLVVSAMFSLAGKQRGASDSASFLPAHTDPPQP